MAEQSIPHVHGHESRDVAGLALLFLDLTALQPERRRWKLERRHARRLLRQSRRRDYPTSTDAEWDLDWLSDLLGETMEE